MRDGGGQRNDKAMRLAEYAPPPWLVEQVSLDFDLDPEATRLRCRMRLARNPASPGPRPDLRLDGRALKLVSCAIDGQALTAGAFTTDEEGLTVPADRLPGDAFDWEAEVELTPAANTALEGLYLSNGAYFTQCEPEGFRKITYFPDRPDVMTTYEARITAPEALPVLLSNGDLIEEGRLPDGRHFARWRDPHPKPSYLFALVAGEFVPTSAEFATASGRACKLAVWVRPGDEARAPYALDALIRSMRWDEQAYGREYDLDLFNIVATDDFNMGAMENKGLNIFNSKLVLASPETATDADYERIEAVIAHEYFHNWTGNRVTCRDWFQLCLKEGLTVFRDQEFTSDMRSRGVKRVEDARLMRSRQFREDAGPLAHPVRPAEVVEINNFYTLTVYEKGAEIVRMLHTLVGPETYRRALDLYFERHDGQAVTIEEFRACFEAASGRDLSQFALWWTQAGTPEISVSEQFENGVYRLTLRQSVPPTPGQKDKAPMLIPIRLGLLDGRGAEVFPEGDRLIELTAAEQTIAVEGLSEKPVPAILRGFSAPVRVLHDQPQSDLLFLLAHDRDPYTRWRAGRAAMQAAIVGHDGSAGEALTQALDAALGDDAADPAFRALLCAPPSEDDIAGDVARGGAAADPAAIHDARNRLRREIATGLNGRFEALYVDMAVPGPFRPDAADAGKRSLRNAALSYLALLGGEGAALAHRQFETADNMTERLSALTALVHTGAAQAQAALDAFHAQWRDDPLVLDKWLSVQATSSAPGSLKKIAALAEGAAFNWANPNRFRALIGAFAMGNPSVLHAGDGSGYRFLADWVLKMDGKNPQTAARVAGAFETWRRYDAGRQEAIRRQLERISGTDGLSKDLRDIVGRILAA